VWSAVRRLGLFLVVAAVGLVISHTTQVGDLLSVEKMTGWADRMGPRGPLLIVAAGLITPMLFLPRWPIAFLAGLLYGVIGGTALAVVASTGGAWLNFWLSRTLLAPMTDRLRRKYRIEHLTVPRERQFLVLFILRAFPLTSFVMTNLIAGALKLSRSRYIAATFLGMIPSTVLYASAGKLMKKPDPHFYAVAGLALVLMVVGAVAARRWVQPWLRRPEDAEAGPDGA
jgi:uncharacterized membrane protein YdjX (TVP38/TMEM64 family)